MDDGAGRLAILPGALPRVPPQRRVSPINPPCACERACGDVPEDRCHPLAVCKGLPVPPSPPLVTVVLVHRDDPYWGPGGVG